MSGSDKLLARGRQKGAEADVAGIVGQTARFKAHVQGREVICDDRPARSGCHHQSRLPYGGISACIAERHGGARLAIEVRVNLIHHRAELSAWVEVGRRIR